MPIYNVTSQHFDHECHAHRGPTRICFHQRQAVGHETIERIHLPPDDQHPAGYVSLVIVCPDGHRECLNGDLSVEEETALTRDEESREQVRNVRALHKHLGIPLVEERQSPVSPNPASDS